jgi:hypothetical protein
MFELAANTLFVDFCVQVHTKMNLDPRTADLGYRFSYDLRSKRPSKLRTADDFHCAIEEGVKHLSWACTRRVVLEIMNLVSWSSSTMIDFYLFIFK